MRLHPTIVFDLSEVYLHGFLAFEQELEASLNVRLRDSNPWIDSKMKLFRGEITEDEFWVTFAQQYRSGWQLEALKDGVRQGFEEIEGTRDILEELHKTGYRLGLLSVHAREWIDFCEDRYAYHKLFDAIVYSFDIGSCKPDVDGYLLIAKRLDTKPDSCVFIDDQPVNLAAASKLGMTAIGYTTTNRLRVDLHQLGVEVAR